MLKFSPRLRFSSCWVFSLERLDEVGQIVAQMWGLIVGYIFPCHSKAIGVVVHQCGNPIVCGKGRGIDVYCRTVCLAPVDDFLSPVSEEVGCKAWGGFGAVA